MQNLPLVTIVIPTHNAADTIGIALSSALNQTYRNVEVIIVDDGSTDGTRRIVEAYEDERVRLIAKAQGGAASARNAGLRAATGDLVAFLDDDDYLFPDYLTEAFACLRPGKWFVTSNAYFLYASGISPRHLRHRQPIPGPGAQRLSLLRYNWLSIMSLFPRSMLQDVEEFDESLRRSEDWEFWLQAVYSGWRVTLQPKPLAMINRSQISQSSSRHEVASAENQILQKFSSRDDLTPEEQRCLQHRLLVPHAGMASQSAHDALAAGDYRTAGKLFRSAVHYGPPSTALRLKAAGLTVAPRFAGPLLRRRHLAVVAAGLTDPYLDDDSAGAG